MFIIKYEPHTACTTIRRNIYIHLPNSAVIDATPKYTKKNGKMDYN